MSERPGSDASASAPAKKSAGASDTALGRRQFLKVAVGAGIGTVGLATRARAVEKPQIQKYVTLGRTGLKISDIGFGSGGCQSADTVRYCYDRGINYFDTATSYRAGLFSGEFVESMIGQALNKVRDKVVLTTKQQTKGNEGIGKLMFYLDASLRRMQTDYVDIYMNHAVNDVARLKHDNWWEFIDRAKQAGKIRFSGMSGHGGRLRECLDYAIDHDLVDVVLAAYNFGSDPAFYEGLTRDMDVIANQQGLPEQLKKAKARNMGVIAMKTLMGAKLNDLKAYQWGGSTFAQAAFRWVLSNQDVDALVVSMSEEKLVDEYVRASGERGLGPKHAQALRNHLAEQTSDYCRPGCDACESSCPAGVPIADVLRQRMYDRRYGFEPMARTGYAQLGAGADACLSCDGSPCAGACPHRLEISRLTRETAKRLGSA